MRIKLLPLLAVLFSCIEGLTAQQPADSANVRIDYPIADYNNPKMYIVNDVTVHGVQYVNVETLAATAGIIKGDTVYIPSNYVSNAIENILNRRYFSDVNIVAEPIGDSVNFDIYVTERPRVYRWELEGVKKTEAKDLKDKMKLRPGEALSDYIINKHSNYIKDFFRDKAFRNTEVDVRIENDTTYQNAVNVTFVVDKHSKVKIGSIRFFGNEEISDKRLRKTLKKTKQKGINVFANSKLKEKEYGEDKEKLIDFYNARGYRNANIVSDSIYDINSKRLGIDITVEEGNKYYFRNISWVGNSKYDTEMLQNMLGIQTGDLYDKKTLHKRLGTAVDSNPDDMSVTSLYQNDGYLFFRVEPSEIIVGADSIDLEIKVFEGRQATINNIIITGNERVNDEVIRRELYTRPGELYDRSLLMSTMRQLSQMKHFNPEAVAPSINPVTSELVDITWSLQETPSDNVEISGGWGAGSFVGSVALNLNNFSIQDMFKKGAWRPYPHGRNQQLSIRAQTNGSYYKAFSLSFTEPWLGGKKPVSLTVGTHFSDETNSYNLLKAGDKHFRTIGVSAGIGRRLSWPDPYFTLYNEVSYQAYNLKDWDNFIVKDGTSNIIALKTVFGRSSVDQPIFPRRGSEFSFSLTLTPPYSLFDNRDYSNPDLSNNARYGWIEYHKWMLSGKWFTPLSKNSKLVLMARAEMGYLGAYDKNRKSPFEGFEMGGSGMSGYNVYGVDVIGLRGYEDGAITPGASTGDYARVYNKYTLEVRYPFILQPSTQIYGLVFAEGGNAFSDWNRFNAFQLKRSLGVGLRISIPIVGMLGVDWGYGFDKVPGATKRSGGRFAFVFGQQF